MDAYTNKRIKRPDKIRPAMSRISRAKLFAPFAALSGMDDILKQVESSIDPGDPEHIKEFTDIMPESGETLEYIDID